LYILFTAHTLIIFLKAQSTRKQDKAFNHSYFKSEVVSYIMLSECSFNSRMYHSNTISNPECSRSFYV